MTGRHHKGSAEDRGKGPQGDPNAPTHRVEWVGEDGRFNSVIVHSQLACDDRVAGLRELGYTPTVRNLR